MSQSGRMISVSMRRTAIVSAPLVALLTIGCPQEKSNPTGGGVTPCTAIISESDPPAARFPRHENVVATVFFVGEDEAVEGGIEHNSASAWDPAWETRYGGPDQPIGRSGYCPATFIPKENPFYVALPYNDLDEFGQRRKEAPTAIPWFAESIGAASADAGRDADGGVIAKSVLEHRWVEVTSNRGRCYGQWESVGPILEDDVTYVFGNAPPRNTMAPKAGIDVSPAMASCLNIDETAVVSWRFVDVSDVPVGPWSVVVTKRR
jgi:hypothetical protein